MSPELCGIIILILGLSAMIGAMLITIMVYEWFLDK